MYTELCLFLFIFLGTTNADNYDPTRDYNISVSDVGICCAKDAICMDVENQTTCEALDGLFSNSSGSCKEYSSLAFPRKIADFRCGWQLEPFIEELPILQSADPISGEKGCGGSPTEGAYYEMTISQFSHSFSSDLTYKTEVWGYNGILPGPYIEACENIPVVVNWRNNLTWENGSLRTEHLMSFETCNHGPSYWGTAVRTVPHLHGAAASSRYDGYPEYAILPGENDTYYYPNQQRPSMYFYHDHSIGIARMNIQLGLYGPYVIRDPFESAYNLPSGKYEIVLCLTYMNFNPDGTIYMPWSATPDLNSMFAIVNGKHAPWVKVDRAIYRLRLINNAVHASHSYYFTDDNALEALTIAIIGTDGGLLSAPIYTNEFLFSSGERLDVLIDFRDLNGSYYLRTPSFLNILKFFIDGDADKEGVMPTTLDENIKVLDQNDAIMTRNLLFHRFDVDEKTYDECSAIDDLSAKFYIWNLEETETNTFYWREGWWDDIEYNVKPNTIELWHVNNLDDAHNLHIHNCRFQPVGYKTLYYDEDKKKLWTNDSDAAPAEVAGYRRGWKDVIDLPSFQRVTILVEFFNDTGRFPYHCHFINHEDHEMMRQMRMVQAGDCNNNSICETGEDCVNCPKDCLEAGGYYCGNYLCEAYHNETCENCPNDCLYIDSIDFCCGSNFECRTECLSDNRGCRAGAVNTVCCGDAVCDPHSQEDADNCPIDCLDSPAINWHDYDNSEQAYTPTGEETVTITSTSLVWLYILVILFVVGFGMLLVFLWKRSLTEFEPEEFNYQQL